MELDREKMKEKFAVGGVLERNQAGTHPWHVLVTPPQTGNTHSPCMHKYKHAQTEQTCEDTPHTQDRVCCVFSCLCTHAQRHKLCGPVAATADAVHEYFSQTLWQSFHLHGPDVSS
ncbi:hypothetical protein GOODEAATRI_004592 [Goodea atripinnis]|uniref:Uncharacterized protein n=1 Tax=Goodea atripinnis TaxID=208336 RepID=A0ABV0MYQ2_9TELE